MLYERGRVGMNTETQRLPAALWQSLQDMCYQHDLKFLQDVSQILKIPAADLKKKVLGVRGEPTVVLVDKDPWWARTQCCLMELGTGNMWRRCSGVGESNSYCWEHRHFTKEKPSLRRREDPYFANLVKRYPFDYLGEIVWVCERGTVVRQSGGRITDVRIDVKTGVAHEIVEEAEKVVEAVAEPLDVHTDRP